MSSERGPSEQPFGGGAADAAHAAAAAEAPPTDSMRRLQLRAVDYFIGAPRALSMLNRYLHQLIAAGLLKPLPDLDRLSDETIYAQLDWLRRVWQTGPEALEATLRWLASTNRGGFFVRRVSANGRREYCIDETAPLVLP